MLYYYYAISFAPVVLYLAILLLLRRQRARKEAIESALYHPEITGDQGSNDIQWRRAYYG